MSRSTRLFGSIFALGAVLAASSPAAADPGSSTPPRRPALDALDAQLSGKLRSTGERFLLRGVGAGLEDLELEPARVFSDDARMRIHGPEGVREAPIRDLAFFRGRIAGRPDSAAVLSLAADDSIHGFVVEGEKRWLLEREADRSDGSSTGLVVRRFDEPWQLETRVPFACDADTLSVPPSGLEALAGSVAASTETATTGSVSHTARVGVETDWELRQKFPSSDALVRYVGDLFNYASSIYEREVATNLLVTTVSVWETSNDPWAEFSTGCGLLEFGRYWNDNRSGETRTIAHFLSGKSNGGGIAWRGVLCEEEFAPGLFGAGPSAFGCSTLTPENDDYGGAYGFTGHLSGTFDIDEPSVMWDIMAVAHEIGHNFSSPHTHDYCDIAGNRDPVDRCYSGCAGGATGLPGPAGEGSGTIMSYCHLAGGYSNVSLTFGTDHPYGTAPARVPSVMRSHVASRAASYPSCLAYEGGMTDGAIFQDGFESGGLGRWGG